MFAFIYIRRTVFAVLAAFFCLPAVAQQSVFDGIELTAGPLFLNPVFAAEGTTYEPDNLISGVRPETFEFLELGSGSRTVRQFSIGPVQDEFTWEVIDLDGVGNLVLSFAAGVSGVSTGLISIPFVSVGSTAEQRQSFADKWGQQTLDQLDAAESQLPAGQIEIVRQITDIRIVPKAPGIWTLSTSSFDQLIVPQAVIDAVPGGWQGDTRPATSIITDELDYTWRRYAGTLLSQYTAVDFVGAWALPMYLSDLASAPLPSSRRERFFTDNVVFSLDGTATGSYSGKLFSWSLVGSELTLSSGEETFVYTLLDENLGIRLFSLRYSSVSDPDGFQLADVGGRFEGSGVALAQSLTLDLPLYYQSLLNGEPELEEGRRGQCFIIGFTFTDTGQARQLFCRLGSSGTEELFFNPLADIDVSDETVVYTRGAPNTPRRRIWQIVSALGDGRALIIERREGAFLFGVDRDPIPEDFREEIPPRLVVVKPMNLSLTGALWADTDVDADGLSNTEEDLQGTSYTNPDSDSDGVIDGDDSCQLTVADAPVDADGCADAQLDSDNDGIANGVDQCPDTVAQAAVSADGCSDAQTDADGDGLSDAAEEGLGTLPDNPDTDGDGFSDFDEVQAGTSPTDPGDVPADSSLNIIVIKAALDKQNR